ncbi:MAG: BMC domain-containing protein [Candidatus Latescibacteria bacterium]|jgi:ethanolamine utilization protein EutM|nr:BMC domain-containing protein [Candidatus Latescibacterota bacterium]
MAVSGNALGFIETRGFIGCIEAADSMLKAASVSLVGYRKSGSGYIAIMVRGDVGAVKAAVEAGTEAAARVGEVVSTQVIASPHADMDQMI